MRHAGRAIRHRWFCLAAACAALAVRTPWPSLRAEDVGNPGTRLPNAVADQRADDAEADVDNPVLQLVCDPAVQRALQLSDVQVAAIQAVYRKIEPRLWLLRDVRQGPAALEKAQLLTDIDTDLQTLLKPPQIDRLRQLVMRVRGWPGIIDRPAAQRLALSADQIRQIEMITDHTQQEMQRIAAHARDAADRADSINRLRAEETETIQDLLTAEQRQKLAQLLGEPFDLSQVRPLMFQAPELTEVEAWLHSNGIKLSELRGKVVLFHFWSANCVHCIRNLPHYAKWHAELAERGLVVVGMHTPETPAEQRLDHLQAKVTEYKIAYPVAMDRQAGNWKAWANSMWPSVYLVDKQGRVRYWWYGELNWQGAQGEAFMRQKIAELLAE